MPFSIIGTFYFVGEKDQEEHQKTREYLRSIGLFRNPSFDDDINEQSITIELDEMPEFISNIRAAGHPEALDIRSLSARGVLFYIPYPAGEAWAFVPFHQIRCIHTVERDVLASMLEEVNRP